MDRAHASGVTVTLTMDVEAIDAVAYSIVREALTNAARHAPGAQVDVRLASAGAWLRIDVVNGPATRPVHEAMVPATG